MRAPYLEQGLAAEVHHEESLRSLTTPAFGLLEEGARQQHRIFLDLALRLLHTRVPLRPGAAQTPNPPCTTPFLQVATLSPLSRRPDSCQSFCPHLPFLGTSHGWGG